MHAHAPVRRLSAPAAIELWVADLAQPATPQSLASLSSEELAKAATFRFAPDSQRYLHARAALRLLLGRYTGVAPAELRFGKGAFDKPELLPPVRCAFNVSHTGDRALIVIADDIELGVDIEMLREMPDLPELAKATLTEPESVVLQQLTPHLRSAAFLRMWTRKEACLKAVGCGLAVSPNEFDVGWAATQTPIVVPGAGQDKHVHVHSIDTEPGYLAAWAHVVGQGPSARLQLM
jgi:4'-phosphopantetheinyl transferase